MKPIRSHAYTKLGRYRLARSIHIRKATLLILLLLWQLPLVCDEASSAPSLTLANVTEKALTVPAPKIKLSDRMVCDGPYGYLGKSVRIDAPSVSQWVSPRQKTDLCIKHPFNAINVGVRCVKKVGQRGKNQDWPTDGCSLGGLCGGTAEFTNATRKPIDNVTDETCVHFINYNKDKNQESWVGFSFFVP